MFRPVKSVKNQFTFFIKQTFRRHTGREYCELLTRGIAGEKGELNRNYPWAYIRLFALFIALYAVFLLIIRFTGNELFAPTVNLLAAICFNLPFMLFLYELYPERDLSFIGVCLAMLIGGTGAQVLVQVLYSLFPASDVWQSAVYSGFFEELCKGGAAIICIIVAGKRSPLAGFVFGAAVGCGFSVCEDMGYIFVESNELPNMNLTTMITVGMARGASALCTHTLWTAAVGWAYCFFDRHLSNAVFYLVLILSCGLHIAWDLPLGNVALGFVYAGCVIVACSECAAMLVTSRRKVFTAKQGSEDGAYFVEDEDSLNRRMPEYWHHAGHLALVIGSFLMALIAIIYCSVPFRETYGTQKFADAESFIFFMQDGKPYAAQPDRPYDPSMSDSDTPFEEDGIIVRVVQHVQADGVTYNYTYPATYDEVSGNYYYFSPSSISVTVDGIDYILEQIYDHGVLYASFFRLNTSVEVTGYNLESDGGITVFIYDADFVRDLSEPRYTILFIIFASIFAAAAITYVALRIKAWRVKKCLTKNVSSAE